MLKSLLVLVMASACGNDGPEDEDGGTVAAETGGEDDSSTTTPSDDGSTGGDITGNGDTTAGGDGVYAQVIYLNFDGATLLMGDDDAPNDTTSIAPLVGQRAPFGSGPKRDAILAAVIEDFAPFDVLITDERPATGDFTMVVFTPDNPIGASVQGIGPADCDNLNPNNIAFVFGDEGDVASAQSLANTTSSRTGVTLGLDNSGNEQDLSSGIVSDEDRSWLDECSPVSPPANCAHWPDCGPDGQNSYQELLALLGPA